MSAHSAKPCTSTWTDSTSASPRRGTCRQIRSSHSRVYINLHTCIHIHHRRDTPNTARPTNFSRLPSAPISCQLLIHPIAFDQHPGNVGSRPDIRERPVGAYILSPVRPSRRNGLGLIQLLFDILGNSNARNCPSSSRSAGHLFMKWLDRYLVAWIPPDIADKLWQILLHHGWQHNRD